jgi:FkbM family methyltransferase
MTEIPNEELRIFNTLSNELNVVFDVGARTDLNYYEINPNIEYHIFEPEITFFNKLEEKISKIEKHNIHLNQVGLSDKNETDVVYYKNTQAFVKHWCVASKDTGERYDLKKLDDYVIENNINEIDFLKIDVEGLDYNVVLGGLNTIKNNKIKYLQIEYNGGIKQFTELLINYNFYLMVEPRLLKALNQYKNKSVSYVDFNKSLVKLDNKIISFTDNVVSPTGAGGNIFGIRNDLPLNNELIFKII